MYAYEPLPPGAFIRLLDIVDLDPADGGSPVCSFRTICLDGDADGDGDDGDIPDFTAVSYTWDHPTTPVSSIAISNNPLSSSSSSSYASLPLSSTLHELFAELRARQHKGVLSLSLLWIDALCIDQSNPVERADQVAQMGRVFANAGQVMVWLGPSTAETREAFAFIDSQGRRPWPAGWDGIPEAEVGGVRAGLEGVMSAVLARPWFRRIWVIQEAAVSRCVTVACGGDSVGLEALRRCVLAAWRFVVDWEPFDPEAAVLGLWCATRLLAIRDEFLERGSVRFERLLQQAYCCASTDKRDAVFAFLGLADKKLVSALPAPNYTVPVPVPVSAPTYEDDEEEEKWEPTEYDAAVDRVYYEAAVALLCHGSSLDALALAGIGLSRRDGVPSWVPDLRYICFEDPFTIVDRAHWDAGGPMVARAELVAPGKLKVPCSVLDTVETVCAVFKETSVQDHQEAMRGVLALAERLLKKKGEELGPACSSSFSSRVTDEKDDGDKEEGGGGEEEVEENTWLDRLVSILTYGLGVDGNPMGPEYRGFFDNWLRWLQASNPADADFAQIRDNAFYRALYMRLESWRVFGTSHGSFCIGPSETKVGDMVCIVPGCRFPLLVRPKTGGRQLSPLSIEATLIYWCYVDGFMGGGWLDKNQADVELILC
ncbi:heterokaryon incompatibility protein-domain-containing protein [Xylaria sp. FL0933]|nr:heterokaryon incompatibility protein-domain-containing protein [Xylaria sp. FL0933]